MAAPRKTRQAERKSRRKRRDCWRFSSGSGPGCQRGGGPPSPLPGEGGATKARRGGGGAGATAAGGGGADGANRDGWRRPQGRVPSAARGVGCRHLLIQNPTP